MLYHLILYYILFYFIILYYFLFFFFCNFYHIILYFTILYYIILPLHHDCREPALTKALWPWSCSSTAVWRPDCGLEWLLTWFLFAKGIFRDTAVFFLGNWWSATRVVDFEMPYWQTHIDWWMIIWTVFYPRRLFLGRPEAERDLLGLTNWLLLILSQSESESGPVLRLFSAHGPMGPCDPICRSILGALHLLRLPSLAVSWWIRTLYGVAPR